MTREPEGPKPYRVLLADDFPATRRGVKQLLETMPGIEVCCEAANGREALELVKECKPDLVVLDLAMPEMDGLDAAGAIREAAPTTEVLVFTMHFSEELARELLRTGVRGYVLKSDPESELLAAVEHLRAGRPYFTGALAATMAEKFLQGTGAPAAGEEAAVPGTPLTAREAEIIQLVADGKTNKAIAEVLGVSTRTIESHRHRIMHKMKFRSLSELLRFAVRNGLVEP
jgi:DNA-binding NarL/FixJ family response regulator